MSERPMHTVPGAMQRLQKLYAEGEAAVEAGRLDEAVALFTQGIAVDVHFRQRYITQYAQRAFALHRLGRYQEAAADYGKAIELEPEMNQAQYHFQRAMCHTELPGGEQAALADFARAMELNPAHPGPYHLRGKLLIARLGRYEEGAADIDALLRIREVPDGYQLRAQAGLNLGRYEAAAADAARAEELAPDPYNHYVLAIASGVRGDEHATAEHVRALLAGRPEFAPHLRDATELERFREADWFKQVVG